LVKALPENLPVVITGYSPGQRIAREALGKRVEVAWLPNFFRFAVRGFLRRYSPRQLILIEATDLRPLVCLRLLRQELPTALVNGWFDEEWLGADPFSRLLAGVQVFGVRDGAAGDALAGIGIPRERISVVGEMKVDALAEPLPELEAQLQELAGERPLLVAGSTHIPEEPQVLEAFERLGGGERAMLVLAPRRLQVRSTEKLLRDRGIRCVRRSRFPVSGRPAVVLLDTQGELAAIYRLAAAVFLGFSLLPGGGGHNPIEPACFAVPIAIGHYMANFQALAELFDRAGAWQRVADADELFRAWSAWLDAPDLARQIGRRAADLVESQRGFAISRTLTLLMPWMGSDDPTAPPAAMGAGSASSGEAT
jgi:3-deoxy-D-manno-octulosonic-acid transferase